MACCGRGHMRRNQESEPVGSSRGTGGLKGVLIATQSVMDANGKILI